MLKHDVLFTKEGCYLQDASTPPPSASPIRARGNNLYRLSDNTKPRKEDNKEESAEPALALIVKDLNLLNTLNHHSVKNLAWFQLKYLNAIQNIRDKGKDNGDSSFDACIMSTARRKPFINLTHNRCAPL